MVANAAAKYPARFTKAQLLNPRQPIYDAVKIANEQVFNLSFCPCHTLEHSDNDVSADKPSAAASASADESSIIIVTPPEHPACSLHVLYATESANAKMKLPYTLYDFDSLTTLFLLFC